MAVFHVVFHVVPLISQPVEETAPLWMPGVDGIFSISNCWYTLIKVKLRAPEHPES